MKIKLKLVDEGISKEYPLEFKDGKEKSEFYRKVELLVKRYPMALPTNPPLDAEKAKTLEEILLKSLPSKTKDKLILSIKHAYVAKDKYERITKNFMLCTEKDFLKMIGIGKKGVDEIRVVRSLMGYPLHQG